MVTPRKPPYAVIGTYGGVRGGRKPPYSIGRQVYSETESRRPGFRLETGDDGGFRDEQRALHEHAV